MRTRRGIRIIRNSRVRACGGFITFIAAIAFAIIITHSDRSFVLFP